MLRNLDAKQRRALRLFQKSREIVAKDIAKLFGYKPRTAALLCQRWVEKGYLETTDPAKKSRRYKLGDPYAAIVDEINRKRQSNDRTMLLTLESAVDTVKARFYVTLKKVRELEQEEKSQMAALVVAERHVRSVEKLQGKYQDVVKRDEKISEQKTMDETAIRRFWGSR